MIQFQIGLAQPGEYLKLEAMKVADVIYVRITYKQTILRGYLMLSSKNGNNIFELNAECKFPEKPKIVDIPVQICTMMANNIQKISYHVQNIHDKLVGDVLHCLYEVVQEKTDTIEAQCTKHALEDNWVKMTGQ